jgi:DNA-binding MarR family transcriptional regulator
MSLRGCWFGLERMPYDERDSDSGRLAPTYTDEEFINAVDELEPAGTRDIAEQVGCTRPAAYYRLKQLEEDRTVVRTKIGGALVWSTVG